jgi:hypothetical protein
MITGGGAGARTGVAHPANTTNTATISERSFKIAVLLSVTPNEMFGDQRRPVLSIGAAISLFRG